MSEIIEVSKEIATDAGTYRAVVLADPDYPANPRVDSDVHLGVIVASYPGHNLPNEDIDYARFGEHRFRVVARWLRMFHGATVVLPIYSGGGGPELRLLVGLRGDEANAGDYIGIIYDTAETRAKGWGEETPARDVVERALRAEVAQYDAWANGEMTMWAVQHSAAEESNEDDSADWETIDDCGGYYSIEEARGEGVRALEAIAAEAQRAEVDRLHGEALAENERRDAAAYLGPWADHVNRSAIFRGIFGNDELPEIELAGVAVTVYVDTDGLLRVSVHCDAGEPDLPLLRGEGDCQRVAMAIKVNDTVVFEDR